MPYSSQQRLTRPDSTRKTTRCQSRTNRPFGSSLVRPGNFEKTRELGFAIQGFKSRHRKKAEKNETRRQDRLLHYRPQSIRRDFDDYVAVFRKPRADLEKCGSQKRTPRTTHFGSRPSSMSRCPTPISSMLSRSLARWNMPANGRRPIGRSPSRGMFIRVNASDFALIREAIEAQASKVVR